MTRMRLSYRRTLTPADERVLEALAERNGFLSGTGAFQTAVEPSELFTGALGLLRIQAQAEAAIEGERKRADRSQQFKALVHDIRSSTTGAR